MGRDQKYKATLEARLKDLDTRLHGIEAELDEPTSPDVEERATEREGDEVLEQLGNAGLVEIEQIRAALKRIEDNEYGFCTVCGEEISNERLDVVPHAAMCRNCA
jgi:RNA polymerase-binding transcription factor DksA